MKEKTQLQKPAKAKKVSRSFVEKLFDLQNDIDAISKDTTNPFFDSKYFDINALIHHLKPLLKKHGLILHQPILDGKVISRLSDLNGEYIDSEIDLPPIDNPQKIGSAITYYRRYTLASLIALQAQDDDANMTEENSKELPWLNLGTKDFENSKEKLKSGDISMSDVTKHYRVSKAVKEKLQFNK